MRGKYTYVVWIQFLGFRYSGWQRQPGQKTIEGMIAKTLTFIRPGRRFKILGASRTDAKVSAFNMAFQLISEEDLQVHLPDFINEMNVNLPPDIRVLRMHEARDGLNIIKDARNKEYVYFFSNTDHFHPFCAPFMVNFPGNIDIDLMKETALSFEGEHSFHNFTARLKEGKQVRRQILHCRITENRELTANFFPDTLYTLVVQGSGFMRYQIRMMMGALVLVGRGEMKPASIQEALKEGEKVPIPFVAPSSGLFLKNMELL